MTRGRTKIASAALFAIGSLHVAWGLGASWPRIDREPASPVACFAGAGLLGGGRMFDLVDASRRLFQ